MCEKKKKTFMICTSINEREREESSVASLLLILNET